MLGSMGVADRGMGYVDLLLMQYWSPRSPEICPCCFFWGGGNAYKFWNNPWRRFWSVYKVGGAQPPQVSSWGCSSTHSPPGSYVPGYEVLITHLAQLSGTLITLASVSQIVISTGDGDPSEFPQTHKTYAMRSSSLT